MSNSYQLFCKTQIFCGAVERYLQHTGFSMFIVADFYVLLLYLLWLLLNWIFMSHIINAYMKIITIHSS